MSLTAAQKNDILAHLRASSTADALSTGQATPVWTMRDVDLLLRLDYLKTPADKALIKEALNYAITYRTTTGLSGTSSRLRDVGLLHMQAGKPAWTHDGNTVYHNGIFVAVFVNEAGAKDYVTLQNSKA